MARPTNQERTSSERQLVMFTDPKERGMSHHGGHMGKPRDSQEAEGGRERMWSGAFTAVSMGRKWEARRTGSEWLV